MRRAAWPRARAVSAILLLLIGSVVLLVNAHWLSDILTGLLLGGVVASACIQQASKESS